MGKIHICNDLWFVADRISESSFEANIKLIAVNESAGSMLCQFIAGDPIIIRNVGGFVFEREAGSLSLEDMMGMSEADLNDIGCELFVKPEPVHSFLFE